MADNAVRRLLTAGDIKACRTGQYISKVWRRVCGEVVEYQYNLMENVPIGFENENPKIYAMQLYLIDLVFVFATSHDIHSWGFDKIVYTLPGENVRSKKK
jgi:hypothetical protein